jgi:hypothetical protein
MPRLLSAGCSLIWGAELPDSPDFDGKDPPSKMTWPALYALEKGWIYQTCSTSGLSNQGISRYVIDSIENFGCPDALIVQWTFLARYELRFNNIKDNYYTINPWLPDKDDVVEKELKIVSKNWYEHIDCDNTQLYFYLKTKLDLANYLMVKKIPFFFSDTETNYKQIVTKDPSIRSLIRALENIKTHDYDGLGFYQWSKINNWILKEHHHPTEKAHISSLEFFRSRLNNSFISV